MSTTYPGPHFKSGHAPMTAAQRGTLAQLRMLHPRAHVSVPCRQPALPLIIVRLEWPGRKVRLLIHPDGKRYYNRTEVTDA